MFAEFLDSLGLPAIVITAIFAWWINRKLKAVENIVYKDDMEKIKEDLEKEIDYLKDKVKTLPNKQDVEAIETAVSGFSKGFKDSMDRDYTQEQKQWENIHDIEKIIADLRVEIAEIKK